MAEVITMQSVFLKEKVSFGIVTAKNAPYNKILILLHGYNGTFSDMEKKLPLQDYAETNHLLIACPNLGNGYYIDHPDDGRFVGAFLAEELPDYLKFRYGFRSNAEVILAGISMGGYGSVLTACHFPAAFQTVISISGAFIAHDVCIGNPQVVGDPNDKQAVSYFLNTFGPNVSNLDTDSVRNPLAALAALPSTCIKPRFLLTCGIDDPLFGRNIKALRVLLENQYPHKSHMIPGDHTFVCFDQGLRWALDQ